MGADDSETDEKPRHSIDVDAFYIDKYEVSNLEYRRFCEATGQPYPPTSHPWYQDYFNDLKLPVMGVSWTEAQKYAKWAVKRLPTEAEWEKAASWGPRANKKRVWPWGDDPTPQRARLDDANGYPSQVDSHPEGMSAYGVFNMAGNVAEWVDEAYIRYPGNTELPPRGYRYGNDLKVARGGSVFSGLDEARTTYRDAQQPDIKPSYEQQTRTRFGIRCAISANHPEVLDIVRKRQLAK
jgi:formylglycine-generating enzyme required for sulfatase activity